MRPGLAIVEGPAPRPGRIQHGHHLARAPRRIPEEAPPIATTPTLPFADVEQRTATGPLELIPEIPIELLDHAHELSERTDQRLADCIRLEHGCVLRSTRWAPCAPRPRGQVARVRRSRRQRARSPCLAPHHPPAPSHRAPLRRRVDQPPPVARQAWAVRAEPRRRPAPPPPEGGTPCIRTRPSAVCVLRLGLAHARPSLRTADPNPELRIPSPRLPSPVSRLPSPRLPSPVFRLPSPRLPSPFSPSPTKPLVPRLPGR